MNAVKGGKHAILRRRKKVKKLRRYYWAVTILLTEVRQGTASIPRSKGLHSSSIGLGVKSIGNGSEGTLGLLS